MTIQVETPDGGTAEFPDGTSMDVMRNALRAKFGGGPAKQVAADIQGGQNTDKSAFQRTMGNVPGSALKQVKGLVTNEFEAAKALVNPDPTAKIDFIKNLASGIVDRVKEYHDKGLGEMLQSDPVGVVADALSVAFGIRGGVRGGVRAGVRGEAATAPVETLTPAAQSARTALASKFETDNTPRADIAATSAQRPGVAKPLDFGGQAVMGQVERLSNTSMAGRDIMEPFLTDRQEKSLGRISNDLKSLTGTSRTARQAIEQTMEAQKTAADPLYKATYESGDKIIWSNEMERLTGVPEVQDAMKAAVAGWQRSQIAQGYGSARPGAFVAQGGLVKIPGGRIPAFPNIQFWDYTKRNLDGMIQNEIKPDGRLSNKGRELTVIKNKLVGELDKQVPEFKAARDSWSGHSSYLSAVEMGRDILRQPAEDFTAEFNNLSAVDKQGAREAIVSTIVSKLGRNPTKLADLTRDLRSPEMRAKIRAIMPTPEAAANWERRLNFEVKSSELVGAGLKNSATARRIAQAADAESLVGDLVLGTVKAATGSVKSELLRAAVLGFKKARDAIHADRDREMAKILTGQPPSKTIKQPGLGRPPLGGVPALGSIGSLQEQQ